MATYVRLSFTNEEEKLLIGFIERHPALWDASCGEYSNARLRQDYWQCIARQLKKSENDCRRKWRFIRDYYLHKRKLEAGVSDKASSKYHNLNFLRKIITQRAKSVKGVAKRQSNIFKNKLISENDKTLLQHDAYADYADSLHREEHLEEASDSDFDGITIIDIANQNEGTSQHEQEEHEILTDILYDDENMTCSSADVPCTEKKSAHDSAQSTSGRVCDAAQERQERAIDLFFASMAATVKTFPPHMVTQAKATVFQAINELELQLHKQIS